MSARHVSRRRLLGSAAARLQVSAVEPRGEREAAPSPGQAPTEPSLTTESDDGRAFRGRDVVRVGLVGCGRRGLSLLNDLLGIEKVEVRAVCDIVPAHAAKAQALFEKRKAPSGPRPTAKGELHYEELVKRDDLDLVYFPTPWRWHVRMAVAAMEAGKHVAVEVPAAVTLEECWKLVEVSERTRRHCVMLENCNYGYEEMLVTRMVRAGLFGELLHAECAYNHDLREHPVRERVGGAVAPSRAHRPQRQPLSHPRPGAGRPVPGHPPGRSLRLHGLDELARRPGSRAHRKARVPAGDPRWQEKYDCGDVNTSLIKTARGRTILLQHNVANPRPYDRINLVAGTKGIFRDYPARVFFEGARGMASTSGGASRSGRSATRTRSGRSSRRRPARAATAGMDYVMSWRLVDCMRRGLPPDMDVYDAAAWSAPAPLSEMSVAAGSAPVKFPDFTRGRWQA